VGYKKPPPFDITIVGGRPLVLAPVELAAAPDLVVTDLVPPFGCIRAGKNQKIAFTARNQGLLAAAPARIVFFLSADQMFSPDDTKVSSFSFGALNPQTEFSTTLSISFPSTLPKGQSIFLAAFVDFDNAVDESDESNNVFAAATGVCTF